METDSASIGQNRTCRRLSNLVCVLTVYRALLGATLQADDGSSAPPVAERRTAEQRLEATFGKRLAARDPAELIQLATELLRLADGTDDAAQQYVMWTRAAEVAARGADAELAVEALEKAANRFGLDALAERSKLLATTAEHARTPAARTALSKEYTRLAEDCARADRFAAAVRAATGAEKAARKAGRTCLAREAREEKSRLIEVKREYESAAYQAARAALERDPDDTQANLAAGRFHCFLKGDWRRGLGHLVKSLAVKLTPAAERDAREPQDPVEQVAVADAWRDIARSERGLARERLEERANYWYERALPWLDALRQLEVIQKLENLPLRRACFLDEAVLLMTFEKNTLITRGGKVYVKDLSREENHGVLVGAEIVPGQAGAALNLSGDNQHVDCGNPPSLQFTDAFTVCAWVRYRSLQGGSRDYIVSKDDWRSGTNGFVLRLSSDGTVGMTIGSSGWQHARGGRLEKDRWYHVAATFDSEVIKLFIDGAEKGSTPVAGKMSPSRYSLRVGRGAFARDRRFDGLIDEVAVFARALSASEVRHLYRLGLRAERLK